MPTGRLARLAGGEGGVAASPRNVCKKRKRSLLRRWSLEEVEMSHGEPGLGDSALNQSKRGVSGEVNARRASK